MLWREMSKQLSLLENETDINSLDWSAAESSVHIWVQTLSGGFSISIINKYQQDDTSELFLKGHVEATGIPKWLSRLLYIGLYLLWDICPNQRSEYFWSFLHVNKI